MQQRPINPFDVNPNPAETIWCCLPSIHEHKYVSPKWKWKWNWGGLGWVGVARIVLFDYLVLVWLNSDWHLIPPNTMTCSAWIKSMDNLGSTWSIKTLLSSLHFSSLLPMNKIQEEDININIYIIYFFHHFGRN